jgi:hypothetical protein
VVRCPGHCGHHQRQVLLQSQVRFFLLQPLFPGRCLLPLTLLFLSRILSPLPVTTLNTSDLSTTNLARIGVSYLHTDVGKLGEVPLSWGYGGTGKKVSAGNFQDYGQPFGPGDEITCLVDLTAEPGLLSFAKNGMPLGIAYHIPRPYQPSTALFPHVLVKNLSVRVDFAGVQPPNIPRSVPWQPIINGHHPWRVSAPNPDAAARLLLVVHHYDAPMHWEPRYCDRVASHHQCLRNMLVVFAKILARCT